ncbi:MAG: glycosyltransferase family 4 protein [Candidatus Omnitrophota bacterium]
MNIKVCLIHPADLLGNKIGGAETFLQDFIKFSPPDFEISMIGITSIGSRYKINSWNEECWFGKRFKFLPKFCVIDENRKSTVPLALKFTLSLFNYPRKDLKDNILVFNRIESALVFKSYKQVKIAIIHDDLEKMITDEHSESIWTHFPYLFKVFESFVIPSFEHIFTTSRKTTKLLKQLRNNDNEKISYFSIWVDSSIFCATSESKHTVRKRILSNAEHRILNDKWILFVGRLQKVKAPELLIDSILSLKKYDYDNLSLIVIGNGDLEELLKKTVIRYGLKDCVYFFNMMQKKLLADFYRAADVLLITSYFETGPLTALESLCCGTPVVSTDVGEVKNFVKSKFSGEVVHSFNPVEIAEQIKNVLENPHIYSRENCECSARAFNPNKILTPIYQYIENINKSKRAENSRKMLVSK